MIQIQFLVAHISAHNFFSVARADRGGSSSFSHSPHNTNTYGPNIFQKMQVKNGFVWQGTFKIKKL